MPEPTHATIATLRMGPDRLDAEQEALHRFIVPSVRSSPGFVSGTWTLDRDTSESLVVVTVGSEADAAAFAGNVEANVPNQRAAGVELRSIGIVEVAATA